MKKKTRENQKSPINRANAHATASDSTGVSLMPPNLSIKATPSIQRKKGTIQRNEKDEKKPHPIWSTLGNLANMNKAKISGAKDLIEATKPESPKNAPTSKGSKVATGIGVGLDALSEFSSRMSDGEGLASATIGSMAKAGTSAFTSSKGFEKAVDKSINSSGKYVKKAANTSKGKKAFRSGAGMAGSLLQSFGALTGNEKMEDAGKVIEVVSELNPKGLAKKTITEGMMGWADVGIALTKGNKKEALSKIHDQNLSGSKGDIRQGYSMVAATIAGDTRSIAQLGNSGKLKGLGRVGWKLGGTMAKHDVFGLKAREQRKWDRARKLSLYRYMIKAKYGSWKTGIGAVNAKRYEKSSKSLQDRLFLDKLRQMKTLDPSLYRLGLPYA